MRRTSLEVARAEEQPEPNDGSEPILVEPSSRVLRLAVALAVLVLAGGVAAVAFGVRPRGLWPPELLIALGAFLVVLVLPQFGRRIIVTEDRIRELRRGREVARAPLRSIVRIGWSWMGPSLVFENGVRIPFNDVWVNGPWLRATCAVLADARRGGVSQEGDWVVLDFLRFPERCLGCGSAEFAPKRIFAGYRIFLGYMALWYGVELHVPACAACVRRHRRAFLVTIFAALPLLVTLAVATTYGAYLVRGELTAIVVGFVLFYSMALVLPNAIPLQIDSRHLGVGSAAIRFDKSKARFRFKNAALREEILLLAQEHQMEHLHKAALYLKK